MIFSAMIRAIIMPADISLPFFHDATATLMLLIRARDDPPLLMLIAASP